MSRSFKGRVVIAGNIEGEAAVSRRPFNTLASFNDSLISRTKEAVCSDRNNEELYRKVLTGKILCLPQTVGSTSGGLVIRTLAQRNLLPRAFLFSRHIDSAAADGVVLADVWSGTRIVTVDELGQAFLEAVKTGQAIEVEDDGTVVVG